MQVYISCGNGFDLIWLRSDDRLFNLKDNNLSGKPPMEAISCEMVEGLHLLSVFQHLHDTFHSLPMTCQ